MEDHDNFKKKYVAVFNDSMSTTLLHAEGVLDCSGNELMMWGPMDEPMTGEHDKAVKYVTRVVEVDYRRKK